MFGTVPFRLPRTTNEAAPRSLGKPASAFPGRVATDEDLMVAVDRQQTRLALPLNSTDTSMTVTDPSVILVDNLLTIDSEIVKTTGPPAGNVVPIARGFDGTTPAVHLASATVSGFVDAYHHNSLVAEVEAIQQTLGANLANVPAVAFIVSNAYDFAPQTPGGSLTVGNNVITLSPVPKGVNGTDQKHYLYISGGTGSPEAVLITGGTAVSGTASGTLIVNCANTHSGAWTIRTATAGIQEAIVIAGAAGSVIVPAGVQTIYAPISIAAHIRLQGQGRFISILTAASILSGTVISINGTGVTGPMGNALSAELRDLGINLAAAPAADGITLAWLNNSRFDNIWISAGHNGLTINDAVNWNYFSNIVMWSQTNHSVEIIERGSDAHPSAANWFQDIQIYVLTGVTCAAGWYHSRITALDLGITSLYHVHIQDFGGILQAGLKLTSTAAYTTFNYFMGDCFFDAIAGPGAALDLTNAGSLFLQTSWLAASGSNAALSINGGAGFTINGNTIFSNNGSALTIDGFPTNLIITANTLNSPTYIVNFLNVSSGWAIVTWDMSNNVQNAVLSNHLDRFINGAQARAFSTALHVMTNNSNSRGNEFTIDDGNTGNMRGIRNTAGMLEFRNNAGNATAQSLYDDGTMRLLPTAFSVAPAAAACEGAFHSFTDSTSNTWGATIAGGGAFHVLGYSDGTSWTVIGK